MAEFNFSKESCIDNKEVTMQNAIEKLLNGSKYFDIATSYFRLSGLTLIEEAFVVIAYEPGDLIDRQITV